MKHLIIVPLLMLALSGLAQVNQDLRREFPVGDEYDNFNVAAFGEGGVIVFGSDRMSVSLRRWKYLKLDTEFRGIDSVTIDLPRQLEYRSHEQSGQELVILFANEKRRAWRITVIDFATMRARHYNGNLPRKARVREMVLTEKMAYVTISSGRFVRHHLLTVGLQGGTVRMQKIEIQAGGRFWLEGIQALPEDNIAMVYLGYWLKGRNTAMQVQIWNEQGRRETTFDISDARDHNLTTVTGSVLDMAKEHFIFTGAYSLRGASTSTGFFIAEMENGRRKYLEYYNFLDLDKFTDYLPKRQQDRLDRKKQRHATRGSTLAVNFRLISHPVVRVGDRYYFLAEFYYPTYRTETYTTTNSQGHVVTQTRTVFDGFQYTHASMICFNTEGVKLWDSTFEMWMPYKPYFVRRFVAWNIDSSGKVDLFFTSRREIISKSFDADGNTFNERQRTGYDTGGEDDRVRATIADVLPWYGNTYLAHGQQRITDTGQRRGTQRTRRVFFLNKVVME
jgi:hypothetical protein